jgi:uncharacterized protein YrrD
MQSTQALPHREARSGSDVMTWAGNAAATLLAGLAIASGVIGMLVAFDEIGGSTEPFRDGLIWLLGGVILALAAHAFRREHHLVSAPVATATTRRSADAPSAGAAAGQTRDARDLSGMAVFTTDEGRQIGSVRDVLFHPADRAVLALVVTPIGTRDARMFIAREHVRGVGKDAVTIGSEDDLRAFATREREREFSGGGVHLDGMQVMTDQGNEVGKISRVLITGDCRIAGLEAGGGVFRGKRKISIDDVVSIGRDRIIIGRVSER